MFSVNRGQEKRFWITIEMFVHNSWKNIVPETVSGDAR